MNIDNRIYSKKSTQKIAAFIEGFNQSTQDDKNLSLDSTTVAESFIKDEAALPDSNIPENLQVVLDEAGDNSGVIVKAIFDGMNIYESQHGVSPPADLIEHSLHLAYGVTDEAKKRFSFDAATSDHHDQLSLQPNRAVIAILSSMGDAIPFAHYLPADIGSNEAKLAIMSHNAGSSNGSYAQNALLDGANSGGTYLSTSRVHAMTPTGGAIDGRITLIQDTDETCEQGSDPVKLLRGRTNVYVNGVPVARETGSSGSGNSTISGMAVVAGVSYAIGGVIDTDTGIFAITTNPAMPDTIPVAVEGFVDYERNVSIIPLINTEVNTHTLYAKPWRVTTTQTIDARTQMANELKLDPYSESIMAVQQQYANERHYEVLLKARRLGVNNSDTFDFNWTTAGVYKSEDKIWQEFNAALGRLSQKMAIDTLEHGISHLYVGNKIKSQFEALPNTLFRSSGIQHKPCIYRIGRLFGRYNVYYTPRTLSETTTSGQILCIGRSSQVARNPFVLGDAVSPTIIPIAADASLNSGAGFYARNFTCVNPDKASSLGCALVNVINLKG